jgi:hypothetical protein
LIPISGVEKDEVPLVARSDNAGEARSLRQSQGKMIIDKTFPLLEIYSEKHRIDLISLQRDIDRLCRERNSAVLRSNMIIPFTVCMLFVGLILLLGILVAWFKYDSLLGGIICAVILILLLVALRITSVKALDRTREVSDECTEACRKTEQFENLFSEFTHSLELKPETVVLFSRQELVAISVAKLKSIALEIMDLERRNRDAQHHRGYFKFIHQIYFQLGLVSGKWDSYFKLTP